MSRRRVSVVIPSYNHAAYIETAVASVLDATSDDPLELVIVDDGSTDDSVERLSAWGDDERVTLWTQENRGAHAALNRGIEASRGDIVFILNSDDVYAPERIPRFLERFDREPDLVMLASWLQVIDEHGQQLGVKEAWWNMPPWARPRPGPGLAELGDPVLALLETNYVSTTSNVAFRRSVVEDWKLRFRPLRYAHDWEFILAVCSRGGFGLVEEPLVSYRVHSSNTIREGANPAAGGGQMRFEAMWVVARHAVEVCRYRGAVGCPPAELRRRLWNVLPRFGRDALLSQLLALRGTAPTPPAPYDELLVPRHPFRRAAIHALGLD